MESGYDEGRVVGWNTCYKCSMKVTLKPYRVCVGGLPPWYIYSVGRELYLYALSSAGVFKLFMPRSTKIVRILNLQVMTSDFTKQKHPDWRDTSNFMKIRKRNTHYASKLQLNMSSHSTVFNLRELAQLYFVQYTQKISCAVHVVVHAAELSASARGLNLSTESHTIRVNAPIVNSIRSVKFL